MKKTKKPTISVLCKKKRHLVQSKQNQFHAREWGCRTAPSQDPAPQQHLAKSQHKTGLEIILMRKVPFNRRAGMSCWAQPQHMQDELPSTAAGGLLMPYGDGQTHKG